ncbi:hypothetical protein KQI41_05075 [Tissierella pigra]|uniref:Lipoprotein n=1 Tax=Tissierella pigra TaxID=2607614 RepID=A0A6N7XHE8_9FIRM|nr:hypothetical protein [Tissierella pigra]MBU5425781.1 hypothetical protein [Tissierella pigra]MSU01481.1 hypothetical protein [Tissierella pigra]
MNNRNKGFLLILSIPLILASCSNSEPDNEYTKLTDTELAYIENYSTDTIIKELQSKIQKPILEFDNIEIKELNVYEDKLLMKPKENKKEFANIFIDAYLILDKSLSFEEATNLSEECMDKITDIFRERKGGEFRLSTISVVFESENFKEILKENIHFRDIDKDINVLSLKQSEEDFNIQTIIFNEFSKDNEVDILRLGLEDISNNYIIEINIFEVTNTETYIDDIDSKNDELIKIFSNNEDVKKYFKSNSVNKLKLIYNMPWHKEPQLIYDFEL